MAKIICDIQIRFLPWKSCFCCDTDVSCTIQISTVSEMLSPKPYVQQICQVDFFWPRFCCLVYFGFGFIVFWTKELHNKCQNVEVSPGKLRQRAECFPAGTPCLMSPSPSHSPLNTGCIWKLISAVLQFVCWKPCPKLCLVLHDWWEVWIPWLSETWVRTEALADLENRLPEEVKPQAGRDGTCHVGFLKSLLSTAGEAGMASSGSKTIPAEFEQ